MTKKVLIIGGEGNGGVIAACIEDNQRRFAVDEYEVAGFINDFIPLGGEINGYPVVGGTADIADFLAEDFYFMYAIHMIGKGSLREKVFAELEIPRERLATVVHRSAFLASNAVLEPGAFVMANCYIGPATKIGQCTLIMANCVIGHNNDIGPFNHVSAGAVVASYIQTGKFVDICLGATVIEKVCLEDYSVAGAGSLVLKTIPTREVHVGRPAKLLRMVDHELSSK